jgi:NAD(P)-dependent dehydrogenase (short-subunit alcohol dehydrogenase family)
MREDRFVGKVTIVTGGAGGIGEVICKCFAKEGAKVAIVDINPDNGNRIVGEIKASGGEAAFIKTNLAVTGECEAAFKKTLEIYGKVDILSNNAGVISRIKLEDLTDAEWERVVPINGKSYYTMMRLCVPWMAEHGGGAVVNTASLAGVKGDALETVYAFCKAGIIQMSKDIAHEFGSRGVRVNCISPGLTPTALNRHLPDIQDVLKRIPLGRFGDPQDQANGVLFLASDEAAWISGRNLIIDGGEFDG